MTVGQRQVCHCPQPCGRYAEGYSAGKDKALTEFLASLNGPPHSEDCSCLPSQIKRACHRKDMVLMARSSPGLFELVEAWTLEGHGE